LSEPVYALRGFLLRPGGYAGQDGEAGQDWPGLNRFFRIDFYKEFKKLKIFSANKKVNMSKRKQN